MTEPRLERVLLTHDDGLDAPEMAAYEAVAAAQGYCKTVLIRARLRSTHRRSIAPHSRIR